jgi:hypothetical protein
LQIPERSKVATEKVNNDFIKHKKFLPLFGHLPESSWRAWRSRFYNGRDRGAMNNDSIKEKINDNLLEYQLHQEKQRIFHENKVCAVTNRINECIASQIDDSNQYMCWTDIVAKEFSFKDKQALRGFVSFNGIQKQIRKDKKIFKQNGRKIYAILKNIAQQHEVRDVSDDWVTIAYSELKKHNLDDTRLNAGLLYDKFVKIDYFKVLSKTEWDEITLIKNAIRSRFRSSVASNRTEETKKKASKAQKGKIHRNRRKFYMTPNGALARPDIVKNYKFDPAMIGYKLKKFPTEWYEISLEEYEKLTKN